MTILQAIILGIAQGVTEFLPVSSDGHLAVVHFMLEVPNDLLFDVLLHVATLGAILIFFRKRIVALRIKEWLYLAIATIPAAIVGIIAGDWIEASAAIPTVVAFGFLVTALTNFVAQSFLNAQSKPGFIPQIMTLPRLFLMGLLQSFALMPGISRSGLTVATALGQKIERQEAFHWSFLLAIPAIAGAAGLEIVKTGLGGGEWPPLVPTLFGMTAAFVAGMASLYLLQLMIKRASLWYFGVYCMVMAALVLLVPLN